MRVTILASGSKGNASLYQTERTSILVDAGIGVGPVAALAPRLDAVVVTHAHGDHTGNYARLARKLHARVHLSEATSRALQGPPVAAVFSPREPFQIGDILVEPTPLPHDAAQVGLVLSGGGRRVALVTDLGEVPPGLIDHLRGCDTLLIESNHDIGRLIHGPYPDFLKKRVASARGHLSNDQACALVRAHDKDARFFGEDGARTVVLMHLSEQNNLPGIALAQAQDALVGREARLLVASQREPLVVA